MDRSSLQLMKCNKSHITNQTSNDDIFIIATRVVNIEIEPQAMAHATKSNSFGSK